jgi:ferredoxin
MRGIELWEGRQPRRFPSPLLHAGIEMSLKINELCVNCDVCEPACPNQAISMGETIYIIDPARCTECVGHFDEPQCVVVCPVECIDPDPAYPESEEDLLAKLRRLQQTA